MEILTFPVAYCHVPVRAPVLKLYGKALLSCNLLCQVVHSAVKEMLEDGLKWTSTFSNLVNNADVIGQLTERDLP